MKRFSPPLLLAAWLLFGTATMAATVDTITTYSTSMRKHIKAVVVRPAGYEEQQEFPVLYLLHGHGGNYSDWIRLAPAIKDYADHYAMMVVCPDGNISSWYLDSPVDTGSKYETYIVSELVTGIDREYKTIKKPSGRAITGLSMGGHGALYLAFRHQDIFGAAGSMSGGVDLRPFPKNWDLPKRLGSYAANPAHWDRHSVVNLVHLLTPSSLALVIDCGTGDFFYTVNMDLHNLLLERNIPHTYITGPGAHNWDYWRNAVAYQALFMHRFFTKKMLL